MATTLTPNKNLNVIGITDTGWGPPTNTNAETLDKALGGAIGISAVSGTTVMTISDLQNMTLVFSGALGANAIYQVPNGVSGQWVVSNRTTGPYTLTIASQSGGSSVVIPRSTTGTVYVNSSVALGAIRADTPFTSASSDTQVIYNSSGNLIGSGTLNYSLATGLKVGIEDATTNTVVPAAAFTRQSSGTPSVGIGVSNSFNVESSAGRVVSAGTVGFVSTANGVGAESFDYVLNLMAAGAVSEKVRVTSAGAMSAQTVTGNWVASKSEATTGTSSTKVMTPQRTTENVKATMNAAGSAPLFACRAWAHFDGGVAANLIGSGNVTSYVRNSVGNYTINFATNIEDTKYAVVAMSGPGGLTIRELSRTTSSITLHNTDGNYVSRDSNYISVAVFR